MALLRPFCAPPAGGRRPTSLLVLFLFVAGWCFGATYAAAGNGGHAGDRAPDKTAGSALSALDWYYFVAAVNVYPGLESEDLIHELLEPVLGALSPGHGGVRTIGELRDEHLLWPPHLGLGVNLNRHWSLFVEAGYTAGKVRTKTDRTSIILLPLRTDFEIKRGALFGGIGLDYFPWRMPPRQEYDGVRSRLAHARPFLGTRLTWTYATYDAKVKLGFRPFPNFVNLEFHDSWLLPSLTVVGGVDIPLSRDTTLTFNGGYNFFRDRAFDFEGYAFTIQWRRYFNGPRALDGAETCPPHRPRRR